MANLSEQKYRDRRRALRRRGDFWRFPYFHWVLVGIALFLFGLCLLPIYQGDSEPSLIRSSRNNLKWLGLAAHNYHDLHGTLPAGGVIVDGSRLHGWGYSLMPLLDQEPLASSIDPNLPWNGAANRAAYETSLEFFNRAGENEVLTKDGFPVSYVAANSQLFPINGSIRFKDVTDGTSNTVMIGEVSNGLKAWGDPTNVRDVADGIGDQPTQYLGRTAPQFPTSTMFLFGDGSVRHVSNDIEPSILRAIASPAGGEDVEDF